MLPKKLNKKLEDRKINNALRQLGSPNSLVDFSSNDYLGFSNSKALFDKVHHKLSTYNLKQNGATGSRLLSGNHNLYYEVESKLSIDHKSETALIFNSGYDSNLGLLSCVPQRGDVILYDEYVHASIRDGVRIGNAKSYKFKHNNLQDLKKYLDKFSKASTSDLEIYVVTESVFSMDGDSPNILELVELCTAYKAHLIIDEAHALGVFNMGLVQKLGVEANVFARIITFGKALGCHGAAILGSKKLREYLINFSRPFIYTTALPPHSLATILIAYQELATTNQSEKLEKNITFFTAEIQRLKLQDKFIKSNSAIQSVIISGNNVVTTIAQHIQKKGFDVKPILSPTVPQNKERLRFCLHSYNSEQEISEVLTLLATFVSI